MAERVEVTDRYEALGVPSPCPWTFCKRCEGMGLYPMRFQEWLETDKRPAVLPQQDENGEWQEFPSVDGYLFVRCDECHGSGRRIAGRVGYVLDLIWPRYYVLWFPLWAAYNEITTGFVGGADKWQRAKTAISQIPHMFRFIRREMRGQTMLVKRMGPR